MAEQTVVLIVRLEASSKEARGQILNAVQECCEYARAKEPGTLKYAICLPDNPQDETNIYIFEEYVDKNAFDSHMKSPPVTSLLASLEGTKTAALSSNTETYTVSWITSPLLSRNDRLPSQLPKTAEWDLKKRVEKPYVLYATITDPDQRDIDTLEPYGAAIVKYAIENEPDTIFYSDARPLHLTPENPAVEIKGGFICAVEVYANKEACMKHLQDQSVRDLAIEGHKLGSKFEIVQLNMISGWLTRE